MEVSMQLKSEFGCRINGLMCPEGFNNNTEEEPVHKIKLEFFEDEPDLDNSINNVIPTVKQEIDPYAGCTVKKEANCDAEVIPSRYILNANEIDTFLREHSYCRNANILWLPYKTEIKDEIMDVIPCEDSTPETDIEFTVGAKNTLPIENTSEPMDISPPENSTSETNKPFSTNKASTSIKTFSERGAAILEISRHSAERRFSIGKEGIVNNKLPETSESTPSDNTTLHITRGGATGEQVFNTIRKPSVSVRSQIEINNTLVETPLHSSALKGNQTADNSARTVILKSGLDSAKNQNIPPRKIIRHGNCMKSYGTCPNCKGLFKYSVLLNHINTHCKTKGTQSVNKRTANAEDAMMDATETTTINNFPLGYTSGYRIHPKLYELLSEFEDKSIVTTIKNDMLLIAYGSFLCKKYILKNHIRNQLFQKLHELARFLICIRSISSAENLADCCQPCYYLDAIKAARSLYNYNTDTGKYEHPYMVYYLQMYLKECTNVLYERCSVSGNDRQLKLVSDYLKLISDNFATAAFNPDSKSRKVGGLKLLPLILDIQIFRDYLVNKAEDACNILAISGFNFEVWKTLVEVVPTIICLFNGRTADNVESLLVTEYKCKKLFQLNLLDNSNLTTLEKLLYKNFQIIRTEDGAQEKIILLRKNHVKYCDVIMKYRKHGGSENNDHLFGLGEHVFVKVSDIIRRETAACSVTNPDALNAYYFNYRHMAITFQLLEMNSIDAQLMAKFIKCDYKEIRPMYYRTPNSILLLAKITKLFVGLDRGYIAVKNLQSLDLNRHVKVTSSTTI